MKPLYSQQTLTGRRFLTVLPMVGIAWFPLNILSTVRIDATKSLPAIEPLPRFAPWLQAWRSAPRLPVRDHHAPKVLAMLQAIDRDRPVNVRYFGGTRPGQPRLIQPALLFTVSGYQTLYLSAFDLEKQQNRTFRMAQLQSDLRSV